MQVCLPCEAADAPDAVKAVWKLVDEYTLTEAERAMLKLMRGLDKHLKHVKQATAVAQASNTEQAAATAGAGSTAAAEAPSTAVGQDPGSTGHEAQADHTAMQSSTPADLIGSAYSQQQQQQQNNMSDATQQTVESQRRYTADHLQPQQPSGLSHGDQLFKVTVDQQSDRPNVHQQPQWSTADQQPETQVFTRTPQSRRPTSDLQQAGSIMSKDTAGVASEGPVLIRALSDGRRGKLEYRLSQDDVYSPTTAEIQALLQHSAMNSSHHLQEQSQQQLGNGYVGHTASDRGAMNGMSDGADSAAGSVFANPLVNGGVEGGQDCGVLKAEQSSMLSLIHKIQAVQVGLCSRIII